MRISVIVVLLLLLGAGIAVVRVTRRGFSARERPSALEAFIARRVRRMATPASAREAKNPFSATPEMLEQARGHFADHCAGCHGNDGSGQTTMGQNLYPKPPDMRLPATQNLSDGEIYSIIHNGIRLTGMPAWGDPGKDDDTWKLVLFIRHLPTMTSEEMNEMGRLNPKSDAEREEEKQEEEFLRGGKPPIKAGEHHH
jgi:mono/diheme cytochrome c family protein